MMAEIPAVSVSPTSGLPVMAGAPVAGRFTVSRTSTSCSSVQVSPWSEKVKKLSVPGLSIRNGAPSK